MSYCKEFGKDKVIFATKEDHKKPSTVELPPPETSPGLILPSGEINWNCPCLGGMATGPCGVEFREAFSCFHYSEADPKGSDCYEVFKQMQDCFLKYPTVYNKNAGEDDDDDLSSLADIKSAANKPGLDKNSVNTSSSDTADITDEKRLNTATMKSEKQGGTNKVVK